MKGTEMKFLNKMERKFGRYAIPNLPAIIIALYVAGYILAVFQPRIFSYLTLEPYYILHGQIWRIVTWLIIPPSSLDFFTIFMLLLYYSLGKTLEHTWGTFRFNVYMFSGVLFTVMGAFLLYGVLYFMLGTNIAFGQAFFSTYYVNMSIFLAFAACYPNMEVLLYFLFPVKIKYMGILYGIFIIYEFINSSWVGKVAILASVAFNSRVVFDDVYTEGITRITSKDIRYAREMGCDIKLLGVARNTEEGIEAYVCPMLIPSSHPLASVNDSYNAVFVHGDAVEDAMFFGRGAGELPTASAVVGDIFDIVRNIRLNCSARIGCTCYKDIPVKKMEDTCNCYFLRMQVEDRCGVLAEMTAVFAKHHVSVAQIVQKESKIKDSAEVVVITAMVREGDFQKAMKELEESKAVQKISSMLRVYGK